MTEVGNRMAGTESRSVEAQPVAVPATASPAPRFAKTPPRESWKTGRDEVTQAQLVMVDALIADAVPRLTTNRGSAAALVQRCGVGAAKLAAHARVVDDATFAQRYAEAAKKFNQPVDHEAMVRNASGAVVDKSTGEAWLKTWPGSSGASLEDAVHAGLLLVCDPPGKGNPLSTFRSAFGGPRGAGVEDAITALFSARVLALAGVRIDALRSFKRERAQAEDLVAILHAQQQNGAELLVVAYFLRDVTPLVGAIKAVWKGRFADWLSRMQRGELAAANDVLRAK